MGKSSRTRPDKPCELCGKEGNEVLYRVRPSAEEVWTLACKSCQSDLKAKAEDYQYGGTWKRKKRN